jgi:hypothetical protein
MNDGDMLGFVSNEHPGLQKKVITVKNTNEHSGLPIPKISKAPWIIQLSQTLLIKYRRTTSTNFNSYNTRPRMHWAKRTSVGFDATRRRK